jgi:hypothetical protein
VSCTATLARMLMIAAGHEDRDDVQRCRPYEPNYPSRTLPTGARWPVSGSVGSISIAGASVRPPRRIILDMDDIDDPSTGVARGQPLRPRRGDGMG